MGKDEALWPHTQAWSKGFSLNTFGERREGKAADISLFSPVLGCSLEWSYTKSLTRDVLISFDR